MKQIVGFIGLAFLQIMAVPIPKEPS
jgi:hypothetical protein